MSTNRRIVIGDRNIQKETSRISYDPGYGSSTDINFDDYSRSPSSNYLNRPNQRMKYSEIPRTPSQSRINPREQYFRASITKRKNDGMVSTLKTQLQTLKSEVSRLMNKDTNQKYQTPRSSQLRSMDTLSIQNDRMSLNRYGKDLSDSVSVTSQNLINQPIKRLQNQFEGAEYDHAHYLELQNNLLKTELRNLKNKYNATKQQLRQKCQAMEKKNQYLEISLRRSESQLQQCKKNLEVQLQTLKFQISRKYQQQAEEQQRRGQMRIEPERDTDNEYVREKMKKLYEELSEKNKMINVMNLELNEAKGDLEKKKFELKKQCEKNSQILKQLDFAIRQKSRNLTLIENQANKKNQLQRTIENLRQKIRQMTNQLALKDDIVSGSEQFQQKLTNQLEHYKAQEKRISEENCQLGNQLRKIGQLNQSHEQQINYLKENLSDFAFQIEQLSRNLRLQKQKSLQIEEYYRKTLDETKQNEKNQFQRLKMQFEQYKANSVTKQEVDRTNQGDSRAIGSLQEKDKQINRWKAEYRLLKIKLQQNFQQQSNKRQEIQNYYKSYKQYKSKNKLLQTRNKVLEDSANQYIQQIQALQSQNLEQRQNSYAKIRQLEYHLQQLEKSHEELTNQYNDIATKYEMKCQNLAYEENYRKSIQQKVLNLDLQEPKSLNQLLQAIKSRMQIQDDKTNKAINQLKSRQTQIASLKQEVKDLLAAQQGQLLSFKNKQLRDAVQQLNKKAYQSIIRQRQLSKKQIQLQRNEKQQLLNENVDARKRIIELENQLININRDTQKLSQLLNIKSSQYTTLQENFERCIADFQMRIDNINKEHAYSVKNLQSELSLKNQENNGLRSQILNLYSVKVETQGYSFDQALKNQIQAGKKLREQLSKKSQQVYRLRDSFSNLKAEYDNLKSTTDIAKLRFISDKKNIQVNSEVEIQKLKSQIGVQQKKIQTQEQKIKVIIEENKKKDNFIQTYVMSKKLPNQPKQFLMKFLKEYEITVTAKQITQKLCSDSGQIEKLTQYNFNLMKEIAGLKEKLYLYETINVENQYECEIIQENEIRN